MYSSKYKLDSENLKDVTMGNQQETKVLYYSGIIGVLPLRLGKGSKEGE